MDTTQNNGQLTPLLIEAYLEDNFTVPIGSYQAMINPESLKLVNRVEYSNNQATGSSAPVQKYDKTPAVTLDFELVLDCTGVVDSQRLDLRSEITEIKLLVYSYNGLIHRPNFAQIVWGSDFVFRGVLTSLNISYTLFRPDGTPLRAKLGFSFESYQDPMTALLLTFKSSPDLTHEFKIQDGHQLAELCQRTYGSCDMVVPVAKANRLNKFRQIKPGTRLYFPPLQNARATPAKGGG